MGFPTLCKFTTSFYTALVHKIAVLGDAIFLLLALSKILQDLNT